MFPRSLFSVISVAQRNLTQRAQRSSVNSVLKLLTTVDTEAGRGDDSGSDLDHHLSHRDCQMAAQGRRYVELHPHLRCETT